MKGFNKLFAAFDASFKVSSSRSNTRLHIVAIHLRELSSVVKCERRSLEFR